MGDFQTNGVAKALQPYMNSAPSNNVVPFKLPDWVINEQPAEAFAALDLNKDSLSAGLEADIDEIRSAASAIPPSAIASEPEWMKFARALAYEAAVHPKQTELLWEILDTASRSAPGYNEEDNRNRFNRYISEALNHPNPIKLATLFHMASQHGWQGLPLLDHSTAPGVIGATGGAANTTGTTGQQPGSNSGLTRRSIHISSLPLIPPKREWLHGVDLIRGAVTILVAPGGRAKSTWFVTCALACASGRPLLGSHVFGGPLCVLYLSTEDGTHEMALRIRAATKHYGLTNSDVPGLHVIAADRWRLPLLKADGNRAVVDQRGMDALKAELDHLKPDVLIIDP